MNYKKIYDNLITRASSRILNGYSEKHHIVPRCLGGSDDPTNLVDLTPEEHYVAHQLLVKIYPDNPKIIRAAVMMIPSRPSNKMYGWLRKKFAKVQSKRQSGKGNSQFGTKWIHNKSTMSSMKISKSDPIPLGWESGRIIKQWNNTRICEHCKISFTFKAGEKYCTNECKYQKLNKFVGREEEFLSFYKETGSMNKSLKKMGFPGAISHWYKWARKLLDQNKNLT